MKSFFKLFGPALFTLVLMCFPLVSLAVGETPSNSFDSTPPANSFNSSPPANSFDSSRVDTTCAGGRCTVENPLKVSNFCDLLRVVLNALIIIGLPVAVVFLVLVGFKFITAQGNSTKVGDARRSLLYTVIGIAIFLGAWTIAEIIRATLQALGVPGFGSC